MRKAGLALTLLALATPAEAAQARPQDPASRLRQTEQARAASQAQAIQAKAALAAAQARADQIAGEKIAAAAALQTIEGRLREAGAGLDAASRDARDSELRLRQQEAAFSSLLPLVLRLSRYPAETVLAVPAKPDQALEGLLIARGLATQLNQEAAALRAAQQEAAARRTQLARQQAAFAAAQAAQITASASLDAQLAASKTQISQAEQARQNAMAQEAALAAQAQTLRGVILAMAAAQARQKPAARAPLPSRPGRFATPVSGAVLRAWGAPAEDGPATGMTIAPVPGAVVVSPCAGRVGFAAPFRSYGQLLIIECGGGIDVVLAGLGRIDAAAGAAVRPGEPLGKMPAGGVGSAKLYVELRRNGDPVDPAPFLNTKL